MEYTCSSTENKRILIVTDIHNCDKWFYNIDNEVRMNALCRALKEEYETNPYDMILCLGDYSLDFWCWPPYGSYLAEPSVSWTKDFVEKVMPRFPLKPYLIPGNHEQYGQEKWKELTGFPRQFSVVYGDVVFLMLDTFAGELDPTEHSDGVYTGIDVPFIRETMERHPDKKIVLCMHDLKTEKESEEARRLVAENPRIICAFAGHIHKSHTKILDAGWRNLPVFYCGDFSYQGMGGEKNWGFQRLDLSDGFITQYCKV